MQNWWPQGDDVAPNLPLQPLKMASQPQRPLAQWKREEACSVVRNNQSTNHKYEISEIDGFITQPVSQITAIVTRPTDTG